MAIALNNKIQYWSARVQNGPVGEFFRWWSRELQQALPAKWQERLQHALRRVILQSDSGQLRLGVEENKSLDWLETYSLDQDVSLQRQRNHSLLEKHDASEVPRFLLLDPVHVLRKELKLPVAAESNLQQVLTFEMDRQTPFRAGDVYFTWKKLESEKESGQFRVQLFVVPRRVVDPAIEKLATSGLAVSGVDILEGGETAGVNLLPAEKRLRVLNPRSRLNWGLAAAAVVLLLVLMVQSLSLRAGRVDELEIAIADVQDEARRVQRLREQVEETSEAASFLTRRRAASPMAIELLADITRILPDNTYLDRLVISEDSVLMQGKSSNAQQLIELVNKDESLDNAAFRGSTRLDTSTGLEIFEVSAEITPGEDS